MFWILPMACGIVWSAGNTGPDDPVVILKWREGCTWTRLFSGALLRALQSYVSWKRLNWPSGERREIWCPLCLPLRELPWVTSPLVLCWGPRCIWSAEEWGISSGIERSRGPGIKGYSSKLTAYPNRLKMSWQRAMLFMETHFEPCLVPLSTF